jgi:hypothetical protein
MPAESKFLTVDLYMIGLFIDLAGKIDNRFIIYLYSALYDKFLNFPS